MLHPKMLSSVMQVLLAKYTMEEDIVLGTPVANRDMAEVQDLLGCFVKYVAVL